MILLLNSPRKGGHDCFRLVSGYFCMDGESVSSTEKIWVATLAVLCLLYLAFLVHHSLSFSHDSTCLAVFVVKMSVLIQYVRLEREGTTQIQDKVHI